MNAGTVLLFTFLLYKRIGLAFSEREQKNRPRVHSFSEREQKNRPRVHTKEPSPRSRSVPPFRKNRPAFKLPRSEQKNRPHVQKGSCGFLFWVLHYCWSWI